MSEATSAPRRRPWRLRARLCRLFGLSTVGTDRLPQTGPYVLIAPHLSLVDPIALWAALPGPARFFTDAFYLRPPLSLALRVSGAIPVDRRRPDPASVRAGLRLLARGGVLAFFPEGGRSWTGSPAWPMPPATKLVAGLRVPVFVAAVDGAYDFWPRWSPWPRPRRLRVRIMGPLSVPRPASDGFSTRRPRPRRARWWTDVFRPTRRATFTATEQAIRDALRASAAGEADALRLGSRGRRTALASLFGFCPDCAMGPLTSRAPALSCASCGAAWRVAETGSLHRAWGGTATSPVESVHSLFERMTQRLTDRARHGLTLTVPVEVAEVPTSAPPGTGSAFESGEASLAVEGLTVRVRSRQIRVPLAAFARAQVEGSALLELPVPGAGVVLRLRGRGAALRLLLAGRALARLPLDRTPP